MIVGRTDQRQMLGWRRRRRRRGKWREDAIFQLGPNYRT
jgi:hypothetical protein